MKLIYTTRTGSQDTQPSALDTTLSQTKVYVRKNIQEIEQEQEDGSKVKLWQYDEAVLTREEYDEIQPIIEILTAQQSEAANTLTVMSGLADVYEAVISIGTTE